jgi:hypothetical protein
VPPPIPDPDAATKKRLDYLSWRAHDAERKANDLLVTAQRAEQENARLRAEQLELARRMSMPRIENYGGDPAAFQQAVEQQNAQYLQAREQMLRDGEQRQQQVMAQVQLEQVVNARVAEAEQKFPDYREVVSNPALPPMASVAPRVFVALMKHEKMPELTYFLGKNPSEAHRIVRLGQTDPDRAVLELGVIAAKLPEPSAKATSNAPAPPSTVGTGRGVITKDPQKMTYKEFSKWWEQTYPRRH